MSKKRCVAPQVIQSVCSTNLLVNGVAPAQASAMLAQSLSHSVGLAAMNAVVAQQQSNLIHQATTTIGVSLIYTLSRSGRRKKTRPNFR